MPSTEKDWVEILLDYGISIGHGIAGAFGALASLLKNRELTLGERLLTLASGFGTAVYITPMLTNMMNLPDGSSYGVGFVIGFAGLKVVEWMIAAIRDRLINSHKP